MRITRLLLLAVCMIGPTFGCTPAAVVRFTPISANEIDPPGTDVREVKAKECYWWIDDDGEMNIALRHEAPRIVMGLWTKENLSMSFVLGDPPAGRARNYNLTIHDTRAVHKWGFESHRYWAYYGIVSLIREGDEAYGSFRVWMIEHPDLSLFAFLPRTSRETLCFGNYRAQHDRARGEAIRAYCEESMPRGKRPQPTTQPTSQPASEQRGGTVGTPDAATRESATE